MDREDLISRYLFRMADCECAREAYHEMPKGLSKYSRREMREKEREMQLKAEMYGNLITELAMMKC